jgi:hypothetical protein
MRRLGDRLEDAGRRNGKTVIEVAGRQLCTESLESGRGSYSVAGKCAGAEM